MKAVEVHISDRQSVFEVQESLIRSAVLQTLQSEGVTYAEVSVAILDDSQIRPINREFLGHDQPTDTISFRLDDGAGCADKATRGRPTQLDRGQKLLGEVLVSAETAIRAARTANWPAMHELTLYVVHASLHLTGHDDHSAQPRRLMRKREREVLASLGIEMPPQAAVDKMADSNSSERSAAS